jgi:hypothetical protein
MTYDDKFEYMLMAIAHSRLCATCRPAMKRVLVELDNDYRFAWLTRVEHCPRNVLVVDTTH